MKLKGILVVLAVLGGQATLAQTRTPVDSIKEVTKASRLSISTIKKSGVSGLIEESKKCWGHTQRPYCLYLDMAARRTDEVFGATAKIPPHEYFERSAIKERSWNLIGGYIQDEDKKLEYLDTVESAVNQSIDFQIKTNFNSL
jgi:hypothetical protein